LATVETSRDTLCLTAQWLLNSVERWAGADYWFGRESGAALTAGGRLTLAKRPLRQFCGGC
jgi:hypothetical protein